MTLSKDDASYKEGGIRELLRLFFPALLMTFSVCISLFVEKLYFARISAQVMEAAVSAAYACQVFQAPCVALAMMTQVCVGRWHGGLDYKAIGAGVWQFIWFSCLSLLITVPLGILYGKFYFHNTVTEVIGLSYYHCLIGMSFLFSLGATLSCFFLGQKKMRVILFATLISQAVKLSSAYLLIFGWQGIIPSFGLMGGILSTLLSQGGLCLYLFWVFINSKNAASFNTRAWRFQPKLFWECIYPGLLRASNRILSFTSWASIAQLMSSKGGDFVLFLSIGGTLFLFLPFLGEAVSQAQTTIVSQILGSRRYHLLSKAFRSGLFFITILISIVSVPLILFPTETFHFLFPAIDLDAFLVRRIFFGIWLSFTFYAFTCLPISYILAFKDTKFSFFMGAVNWVNGFLLMFMFMDVIKIGADKFWLALSLMHFTNFVFYCLRMRWLQSKTLLQDNLQKA